MSIKFRPDPKPNFSLQKKEKKQRIEKEKKIIQKSHEQFYKVIGRLNPHRCFECNEPIHNFNKRNAHHLIEKRLQKHYSVSLDDPENGVAVCYVCHDQVRINIDKVPKIKQKTKEITDKYEKYLI